MPTALTMKKRPNRLLEVFVVVTLLALVIVILVGVLDSARYKTENVTVISQVREYRQALDAYFLETGHYPYKEGVTSGIVCLGDYKDNTCWVNGISATEDQEMIALLVPDYLPTTPVVSDERYGEIDDIFFTGMIYQYSILGRSYLLSYFLSGLNQSCVLGDTTATNIGLDTLCTIEISL